MKIICFGVAGLLLVGIIIAFIFWERPKKELAVYDESGELVAKLTEDYSLDQFKIPYCDVAID